MKFWELKVKEQHSTALHVLIPASLVIFQTWQYSLFMKSTQLVCNYSISSGFIAINLTDFLLPAHCQKCIIFTKNLITFSEE